ncbi:MAG TPA: sulfite exporter TauE/SafE family protein [Thermoanaerobaculia bacterium]|nr:sulfite exporter TauE/SafE family protein [Thermoanaerobaculia bacterium]
MALTIIAIAAFLAGVINSMAGGGTLISFPTMVWMGRPAIMANATNAVALWPGSLSAMVGYRDDMRKIRRWLYLLVIPSTVGGALGAILLLHTSEKTFSRIVPFLILGATILLSVQELISRKLNLVAKAHEKPTAGWVIFVFTFQTLVGLYGGYFGAGMGILMLAALGLIGLTDLHEMNGLKNLLAVCINGVAAIYFAISGAVLWTDAVVMAVAAIAGGFAGAKLAKRLGRKFVRGAVVAIGLIMTVALFIKHA